MGWHASASAHQGAADAQVGEVLDAYPQQER
eukprot:SAG25_NODE_10845_length_321_cov_0.990991_1_plen_30_part_10